MKIVTVVGARPQFIKAAAVSPYIEPYNTSIYTQYIVLVKNREAAQQELTKQAYPLQCSIQFRSTCNRPLLTSTILLVALPCSRRDGETRYELAHEPLFN